MTETSISAERLIEKIESGEVKGAYDIACAALEALSLRAEELTEAAFRSEMIATAERLKASQPSMAGVANACSYVLRPIAGPGAEGLSLEEMRRLVRERSERFLTRLKEAQEKVIAFGANLIREGDRVFVHSYSGTILGILRTAWEEGKRFEVIGTQSHPGSEGRTLAASLLDLGVPYTLIADAAIADSIGKATKALVGADSLLADGSVVNKIGTHLVALASYAYGIPFYVAASTFKFSVDTLQGGEMQLLEKADDGSIAGELAGAKGLRVTNRFFEVTPARLVTAVITERGLIPSTAVVSLCDEMIFPGGGNGGSLR